MSDSRQVRRQQERTARKVRGGSSAPTLESSVENRRADLKIERLIACALIDSGGHLHHGFKSHSDLRASLGRDNPYTADRSDTYGFWTSYNRFVDREEAKLIGEDAGQTRPQQRELLSSDINW